MVGNISDDGLFIHNAFELFLFCLGIMNSNRLWRLQHWFYMTKKNQSLEEN